MQTPFIPSVTNLGASPLTTKAPDTNSEPRFGQMLERQMSQREAAKPAESPKPIAQRQDAKVPAVNSANTSNSSNANSTTAAANADMQDDASSSTAAAAATTATTDANTSTSVKAEATVKKECKTTDTKTAGDESTLATPAEATLAASAAIMALVAHAGSNPGKPAVEVDTKSIAVTITTARSIGNAVAIDLATKAGARDTVTAATIDAAVAQAAKVGADAFGSALQSSGKGLDREAIAQLPVDLAQRANNELAQIAPQLQQTAFEVAPPTGSHPGDILAPRIGNDNWNQALGQRMVWMAAGAEQSASLTLNPPDLGPMQVVLHVSNGQADASFFAAQPEVRQALEAAMPKLREMLSDAGVTLGQASVSAGQPQQQQSSDRRASGSRTSSAGEIGATGTSDSANTTATTGRRIIGGNGLVDTFA